MMKPNEILQQIHKKINGVYTVWVIRAIALILMVLLAAAGILYAAGKFDLSFVTRPAAPEQTTGTQAPGTSEESTTLPGTTAVPWTGESLTVDGNGAGVTLDAFLSSLPNTDEKTTVATEYTSGKTVFKLCPVTAETKEFAYGQRAVNVITKTVDMVNSYKTTVTAGTEYRPALEAVGGCIVKDHGDGSYAVLSANGTVLLDGLQFDNTVMTGLTDSKNRPIFLQNGGYCVLDNGALLVDDAESAVVSQRSTCTGATGAQTNGLIVYTENGLYGYQNADGTKLTEAVYVRAFPFSNDYGVAFDATQMYILDTTGAVTHQEEYTVSSNWQTNIKLTLPDTEGLESLGHFYFDHGLMRVRYRINYNLYNGYYDVKLSDREVLMDVVGNVMNPPAGYEMTSYHDGIAVMRHTTDGVYGLTDVTGTWITPPVYTDARACVSGLIPVQYNGKWGLLDRTGKFAVPPVLDTAPAVSGGVVTAYSAEHGWMTLCIAAEK